MEQLPDKLAFLYYLYKNKVKQLEELGYSSEEAFWIQFAHTCFYEWDADSETEIRLSEILGLYLSIYTQDLGQIAIAEDKPTFLKSLIEKYYTMHKIAFESHLDDYSMVAPELGRSILGKDASVIKMVEVGAMIFAVMNALRDTPIPIKLVKDV